MNATVQTNPLPSTPRARWIPALKWLRSYERGWLRADIVAGVTLAAYLLPGGIGLPAIHWADLNALLPLAVACFMLGAVETAAIGRTFAAKHGGRLDANQEFLALAASNLAAGLGRGFPVAGGMSQSLVNEGSGARTPLSSAVAAGILLLVTLFLTHLLSALPQPVLAAIVLVAVAGLFQLSVLKHLWRSSRTEFAVAMAALLGVMGSGLLRGVLIGAILSLVLLIRRASHPHVAFLGRIPGTRRFSDLERNPDNEVIPEVLIFRAESGLVYFNVDHVRDTVMERVRSQTPSPRLVICDLTTSPHVDMHAARCWANWRRSSPPQAFGRRSSRLALPCATRCERRDWRKSWASSAALVRSWMSWTIFRNRRQLKKVPLKTIQNQDSVLISVFSLSPLFPVTLWWIFTATL